MNHHLIVDPKALSFRNVQLFKTLSTFWYESGWYDPSSQIFNSDGLLQVLNELALTKAENSETHDLLLSTLSVIDNYRVGSKSNVTISSISFLGDRKFRYNVDTIGPGSQLINFIKHYFTQENLDAKASLERLYLAKKIVDPLREIGIELKFSTALEQREILKAIRGFPVLESSGSGDAIRYSLTYKLQLDSGEVYSVLNSDFAADRGYLMVGSRYIIVDSEMYPAISRQRNLSMLNSVEASAIFNNPTQALFPAGTDTERFDMSEYDARVASFEYAPKVKFREIVSSNISWYKTENANIPYIQFRNQGGQPVNVEISLDAINALISKMEISIESGLLLADGNPRPVEDGAGNLISTSESNLNYLRSFREILRKSKSASEESKDRGARSTKVAVLREVILPVSAGETPKIYLSKDEMANFLKENIKIKDHQVDGVNWLLNAFFKGQGGVFLCDDMGLGKTLQLILFFTILQHIDRISKLGPYAETVSREKASLVVAPLVLINNWESEIQKFVRPEFQFPVYKLHGSNLNSIKNQDGSLFRNWWKNYRIILTNYNTFARYQVDILRYPFLVSFFDESQNIKNPDIAVSRAARGLNSEFVVCATGTPVEIRLMDLWTQMDALKRRPVHPLGREQDFVKAYENVADGPDKIRQAIMMNDADGIMIRRDKSLLRATGELPQKVIHEPYFVQMSKFQEQQEALIVESFKGNTLVNFQFVVAV